MRDTRVTKNIFNNISNFSRTWRNACSVSFLSTATAAMATLPRVPQASRFKAATFTSSEILRYVFSRKVRSRRFLSPSYPWTIWGVKDHFFGFDKDFGGPPASQEWDLWLWSSPLPNHQRRAALWEGEANPLNPHKAPMVCLLVWIKGLIIRGGWDGWG